nr:subtilisin-like protease SBT1.9 [Ipomoea batatas]
MVVAHRKTQRPTTIKISDPAPSLPPTADVSYSFITIDNNNKKKDQIRTGNNHRCRSREAATTTSTSAAETSLTFGYAPARRKEWRRGSIGVLSPAGDDGAYILGPLAGLDQAVETRRRHLHFNLATASLPCTDDTIANRRFGAMMKGISFPARRKQRSKTSDQTTAATVDVDGTSMAARTRPDSCYAERRTSNLGPSAIGRHDDTSDHSKNNQAGKQSKDPTPSSARRWTWAAAWLIQRALVPCLVTDASHISTRLIFSAAMNFTQCSIQSIARILANHNCSKRAELKESHSHALGGPRGSITELPTHLYRQSRETLNECWFRAAYIHSESWKFQRTRQYSVGVSYNIGVYEEDGETDYSLRKRTRRLEIRAENVVRLAVVEVKVNHEGVESNCVVKYSRDLRR